MKTLWTITLLAYMSITICNAAEYLGNNIDGESYSCTAFSYSTSNFYYLTCEFLGDEVILYFPNGGHIFVTMDSEQIDDPSSIGTFDFSKGNFWDLDVDID